MKKKDVIVKELTEALKGLEEDYKREEKEANELFLKIKTKTLQKFIRAWCLAHSVRDKPEITSGKKVEWISPTELQEKLGVSYPTAEEYSKAVRCLEKFRNLEYLGDKMLKLAWRRKEYRKKESKTDTS